nr:hypothetical protein [Tanacetum cinerariifolium]
MKEKCGMPGTRPMTIMIPADTASALCDANIWRPTSLPISSEPEARVTMIAAAVDSSSDGNCATKPSPMHAADEVDEQDQQAGDGVTADEFAGTVHGAVELGFLGDFKAAALGFGLVDEAGVEVGVDGHLFAGHGVEGEAGADFGDPSGTFGDDDEVDDHEDGEDDDTDDVVAADDHFTKGLDDFTGGGMAVLAVEHDDAGGGDVEGQAQQGGDEQDGGEYGEVERPQGVDADEQDDDGECDVEREEDVEQERWHGQHHHGEHDEEQQRSRASRLKPVPLRSPPGSLTGRAALCGTGFSREGVRCYTANLAPYTGLWLIVPTLCVGMQPRTLRVLWLEAMVQITFTARPMNWIGPVGLPVGEPFGFSR